MPRRMSVEARRAVAERLNVQGIRFARSPITTIPDVSTVSPVIAGKIYGVRQCPTG